MFTQESNGSGGGDGRNNWARVCDTCRSAASTVYCRSDCAFLCSSCDARNHAAYRHDRVWVCEACERAPAAFLCKADAASLCTTCDADIHSANSLASRHHRVPIMSIPGCLYGPEDHNGNEDDEDEAASWLLLNPGKNSSQNLNNGFLFGGDEYLDLVDYNNNHNQQQHSVPDQKSYGGDSVVPVQPKEHLHQQQNFNLGILEYQSSKSYTYNSSINHNVSVSSIDVEVPEPAMSDISISHPRPPKGTINLFCGPANAIDMATQVSHMDREARVLRYREKKKMRKFEKTIRYASRKAYAESRPRIKGRFAKRREVEEVEVDQMFVAESGYSIVPSF